MKYVVEINKVRYYLNGNSKKFFIENNKKTPQEWDGLLGKEVSREVEEDINVLAFWNNLPKESILSIRTFLIMVQKGLVRIPYSKKISAYTILTDPYNKAESDQ